MLVLHLKQLPWWQHSPVEQGFRPAAAAADTCRLQLAAVYLGKICRPVHRQITFMNMGSSSGGGTLAAA
jgi:hypothetical protein